MRKNYFQNNRLLSRWLFVIFISIFFSYVVAPSMENISPFLKKIMIPELCTSLLLFIIVSTNRWRKNIICTSLVVLSLTTIVAYQFSSGQRGVLFYLPLNIVFLYLFVDPFRVYNFNRKFIYISIFLLSIPFLMPIISAYKEFLYSPLATFDFERTLQKLFDLPITYHLTSIAFTFITRFNGFLVFIESSYLSSVTNISQLFDSKLFLDSFLIQILPDFLLPSYVSSDYTIGQLAAILIRGVDVDKQTMAAAVNFYNYMFHSSIISMVCFITIFFTMIVFFLRQQQTLVNVFCLYYAWKTIFFLFVSGNIDYFAANVLYSIAIFKILSLLIGGNRNRNLSTNL